MRYTKYAVEAADWGDGWVYRPVIPRYIYNEQEPDIIDDIEYDYLGIYKTEKGAVAKLQRTLKPGEWGEISRWKWEPYTFVDDEYGLVYDADRVDDDNYHKEVSPVTEEGVRAT